VVDWPIGMRIIIVIFAAIVGLATCPGFAQQGAGVHPLDFIRMTGPSTGWASTAMHEVLHTNDGGIHWTEVTPAVPVRQLTVLTSLIAWVQSCMPSGMPKRCELLRTTDGGRAWRDMGALPTFREKSNPTPFVLGGALNFIDARHGWFMTGAGALGSMDVDIDRTSDGGRAWARVATDDSRDERSGLPFGGDKSDITFLNSTTGWVTGYIAGCDRGTYLFVSHDAGRTWGRQELPVPVEITHKDEWTMAPTFFSARDGVLPVSISYASTAEHCESGRATTIIVFYTTHDDGATWTYTTPVALTPGNRRPPSSFADRDHGWVAEGKVLYLTADGGHRWAILALAPDFADIQQLDFVSPQLGWAVRETVPLLLKTTDGGQTWTAVNYTVSRP
jgi:photosystem II stability/assembly factor-like uncharacterized protein